MAFTTTRKQNFTYALLRCRGRVMEHIPWCLIFVYYSSVISSSHGMQREQSQSTRLPTKRPVPQLELNYTLELNNTSPAVLDSAVTFLAQLRDYNGHLVDSSLFQFVWDDSASPGDSRITRNNFKSNITKLYRGGELLAGTYNMMVTVYHSSGAVVINRAMNYQLTDRLNGNLTIHQNLQYQREINVLSTEQPLQLNTSVMDKFKPGMAKFKFMWYHNAQLISTTNIAQLNLSLALAGAHEIAVVVEALVAMDVWTTPIFVTKSGKFVQRFLLKDPLDDVKIRGEVAVPINKLFYLNITCKGSVPTSLCWKLTTRANRYPPQNSTCSPTVFQQSCQHMVNLSLAQPGKYRFSTLIVNDVSLVRKRWILRAYDPDNVSVPAITVPIVFACLACIVILLGAAYIMKLRKKPYVEVANFDFHPSLTREVEDSKLSVRIRKTMQSLLSHPGVSNPRRMQSAFNHYGSLDDEDAVL